MKLKNKHRKGRKFERFFAETIKQVFPLAVTEFKPRVISQSKDFWNLFDGLTFFPTQRCYVFWQSKTFKLPPKKRREFWEGAQKFGVPHVTILLLEKNGADLLYSFSETDIIISDKDPARIFKKLFKTKIHQS